MSKEKKKTVLKKKKEKINRQLLFNTNIAYEGIPVKLLNGIIIEDYNRYNYDEDDAKELAYEIIKNYEKHKVFLKLTNCERIEKGKRLLFDVELNKGTRENLFYSCTNEIQAKLKLPLFYPFKEVFNIHIAISRNPNVEHSLLKILKSPEFSEGKLEIPIALGYDVRGKMIIMDLAKFPHALYGGSSNSGKSVGLQNLIMSIAYKQTVNNVNLLIIDASTNDFDCFYSLPHLSHSIIKDENTAILVMQYLVNEVNRRNSLPKEKLLKLPYIVCVIDEYVSLVNNIEGSERSSFISSITVIQRLGRHAKVHLVLATQEASKQNMLINLNNMNARVAFTCSDCYNSRSILGVGGAEKLIGKGSMLFKSLEQSKPIYLQGAFMSIDEINQFVGYIVQNPHDLSNKFTIPEELTFTQAAIYKLENSKFEKSVVDKNNELVEIIMWTISCESISALQIRNQFHMGNRADNIIDDLYKMHLITEKFFKQPRFVIPRCVEEIPSVVMNFLLSNGISTEKIAAAIKNRRFKSVAKAIEPLVENSII